MNIHKQENGDPADPTKQLLDKVQAIESRADDLTSGLED